MEEAGHDQSSVVYYCPGLASDISELFYASNAPVAKQDSGHVDPVRDRIYSNVRRLLDEHQGDFDKVFVSSYPGRCHQQLELFAAAKPTAVLVELSDGTSERLEDDALSFLRAVSTHASSLHYQRHVMPFVLLGTSPVPDLDQLPDSALETNYLSAGAIDSMRSPLCAEAINDLVGHVKETTKPSARALGAGMAQRLVNNIMNSSTPKIASHRPDEALSAQRKSTVEEAVGKWQFPAHDLDTDELTYGALVMLERVLQNPELEPYRLHRSDLMTFLLAARREYKHEREVFYHNWRHAVDVTQSIYCFLCNVRLCSPPTAVPPKGREVNALERILSPRDALILIISAIGHDVGHPGVNNAFLVASNHELALMYNDKSVLENYHCAAYSQLLRRHWPSVLDISHFRTTMISTILATDMQRHFEYMGQLGDLKNKIERSEANLGDWSDKDREYARDLIMALLIKAADISNVARPFDISAQWAKILMNEFSRQGELENELDMPTCLFGGPPNKEDALAAAQSQKGFMSLFGYPLFRGISDIMPNVSCTIPELENNKAIWERRIADEKSLREAVGDGTHSPSTSSFVTDGQVEEAKLRKRESEPATVPTTIPQSPSSPSKRHPDIDFGGLPVRHPASEHRAYKQLGVPSNSIGEKHASAPQLWPGSANLSPPGGSSRRSSKDVALNQLQELNVRAQNSLAPTPDSRRGSTDASWQVHQNYPGSRRGSKDESLTTILVTSPGSPTTRSVPAPQTSGKTKDGINALRASMPSSKAQMTGSAPAVMAGIPSSSTQSAPIAAPDDDMATPTATEPVSTPATSGESLIHSGDWPAGAENPHHESSPAALSTTPEPSVLNKSSESPQIITRMASGDSAVSHLESSQSTDPHIRPSRSRSRLRGLKFWKKRKGASGTEGSSIDTASP